MKILSVVGARPNLVKIAPILRALEADEHAGQRVESVFLHTGQHYDERLSAGLFADLQIRPPDYNLAVGSGSHAAMTAEMMRRFEPVLHDERPDIVLVVGDVTSTLACALTAAGQQVPVAHVEAGLRSFDRRMPEEVNRVLTDALSDFLFTTEPSAEENLRREGYAASRIFSVGNVMIDSLAWAHRRAERSTILDRLGLDGARRFALLTLHRPSNVDDASTLRSIVSAAHELARDLPVVFPAHPRTRRRIVEFGLLDYVEQCASGGRWLAGPVLMTEPLSYLDCVHMLGKAALVLTDSGGVQEETTWLGVPCLTLRENTERPVTVTGGTNRLVGTETAPIVAAAQAALHGGLCRAVRPPLWDGHAAERIVRILVDRL